MANAEIEEHHVPLQARGVITLPAALRRRHHLDDPGAQVRIVELEDGTILLQPMSAVPADQRWFWTERWQHMEQEANDDVEQGRTRSFDSGDDLLSELDS